MKKFICFVLAFTLVFTLSTPVNAATVSAKQVKTAYTSYLKKEIKNGNFADNIEYNLFDFNKDGIKELVVSDPNGNRAAVTIYTYKNNRVTELSDSYFNGIGYIKGKKYVVGYGSGGALNFDYTVYKISNGKLKKVMVYACDDGVYKKNNKKISENTFRKFEKTIKYSLGTSYKVSTKKYYSPKKLGITVLSLSRKETCIEKANKNNIYYRTITIGDEGMTTSKSKLKSAKITSSTEFYYGDTAHLFGDNPAGKDMDSKKWIYKLSKTQFLEEMKSYQGACDQIIVKNGKAVKVFIHIQVAG